MFVQLLVTSMQLPCIFKAKVDHQAPCPVELHIVEISNRIESHLWLTELSKGKATGQFDKLLLLI